MKNYNLGKSGKMSTAAKVFMFLIIAAVAVVAIVLLVPTQQVQVPGQVTTEEGIPATCPSDLGFSGTVTVQNDLNTTGAETYDNTMKFYELSGGEEAFSSSITDTTSGAVTLTCGKTYVGKIVSASGAAGDNSYIKSASMSGGEIISVNDGYVTFAVTSDSGDLKLKVNQHGQPEIRVFDLENNDYLYEISGQVSTTWNWTDAVNYTSTTNGTALAVGSGGSHHVRVEMRTNKNDEAFNDRGMYLLIDESTSVWDTPVVKLDGTTLSDIKSQLNADEAKAYSDYEYAYLIPKDKTFVNPDKIQIEVFSEALGGVDPSSSDDPIFQFASIGTYTSVTDSDLVKVGAVDDSSSQTQTYTLWTTNFFIS